MNAERLHAVLKTLNADFMQNAVQQKLENLRAGLQNVVNQPNAGHQQKLANARQQVQHALARSPVYELGLAWREVLSDINASHLAGQELLERLNSIFDRNQITPAAALQEVSSIVTDFTELATAVANGCSALETLGIGSEELSSGEFEIGLLIPRKAVDNELGAFAQELKEFNQILRYFSELTTGQVERIEVRRISSSEFLVDIVPQAVIVAAALAKTVNWVLDAYTKILNIKQKRLELKNELPENLLDEMEAHANKLVDQEIEKRVPELLEEYAVNAEPARRNELGIGLKESMRAIADRIDRGFNIEVRACLPAAPEERDQDDAGEEPDGEEALAYKMYEEIRTLNGRLQYIREAGEPILQLAARDHNSDTREGGNVSETEGRNSKKKPRRKRDAQQNASGQD